MSPRITDDPITIEGGTVDLVGAVTDITQISNGNQLTVEAGIGQDLTAGTAVQVTSSSISAVSVVLTAPSQNVEQIFIGDSNVSTSNFIGALPSGALGSFELPIPVGSNIDLSDLYLIAAASSDTCNAMIGYLTET